MFDANLLSPLLRERPDPLPTSILRRSGLTLIIGMIAFLAMVGAAALLTADLVKDITSGVIALICAAAIGVLVAFDVVRADLANRRFQQQRRLLIDMLEGSGTARMIADGRDAQIYANTSFLELVAAAPNGATEALASLFGTTTTAAARIREMASAARAGTGAAAELMVEGGPSPRWLQVSALPIAGWGDHVQWRLEDVTERREMQSTIAEERAKLVDFMENAPVGFFSTAEDGTFLFANATFARWLGVTVEELLSGRHRLHDVLARPPRTIGHKMFDSDGSEQRGELLIRGFDGRVFQAAASQTTVFGDPGTPLRTRAVIRDLTPEQEWRAALNRSEQRFQRFFEDAPIGITLIDADGRMTVANEALAEMLGRSLDDIIDQPLAQLIVAADRERVEPRLAGTLAGEESDAPIELRMLGPNDSERVVNLYATRYAAETSDSYRLILHFIDMTEQKQLEAQFAQSQKMQAVGQLAGGIAHDFNNLLTAIIGFCDLLLLRHTPGDPSFDDIMQIKQNSNRAANLVRQLLAFSRQQTLQPRVLDVTDVLIELAHLLRRLIGENIELDIVHGRDLGLVKVDQGQLEQVLINLAVNARDAMPSGGTLSVRSYNFTNSAEVPIGVEMMPPGEWIAVEVSDTGIGIPVENLERIFEPFFSTKEVGSGTGLGLSTVYGIVRQTGGFVRVVSAPGEGARFTIYLPRHVAVVEQGAGEAEEPRPILPIDLTGKGTILLVEDEDAVRMFSARALKNKGYRVIEASSGEEAIDVLSRQGKIVDLVITDVVMPKMDGPTLVARLRGEYPDLKVVFISGYTEDRFRHQIDVGGEVEFLAKPFTLKQLAAKVKDVMEDRTGPTAFSQTAE